METFRFTKLYKWLHIGSLVLFVALIGFSLVSAFADDPGEGRPFLLPGLMIIVFGPLIWYGLHVLRILDDYVQVDESGIWYVSPNQRRLFVQWRDIAAVRARDTLQRLELCDTHGRVVMKVEYQLEHFERLRAIIHERTKVHLNSEAGQRRFSKGRLLQIGYGVAIAMFGVVALWAWVEGEHWPALGLLGVACYAAATFLFETQWLEVTPNGVVLASLVRNRTIPFESMVEISLRNVSEQYGNEVATVHLHLSDGNVLQLTGFQEGSLSLYKALEAGWTSHRKKHSETKQSTLAEANSVR